MKIRIEVDLSGVLKMFDGMIVASDLEGDLGQQIHQILLQDALAQFRAGGIDPAWQPLAQSTIREKERVLGYPRLSRDGQINPVMVQRGAFGPANILERSGALLSSWTDAFDPDHFVKFTDDGVEMGSTLFYAPYHQDPKAGSRLPKRAIGITDDAVQEIANAVQTYLGGQH